MEELIAILEDAPIRSDEMIRQLALNGITHKLMLFDRAPAMIEWLAENMDAVRLISLDNDLDPPTLGTGRSPGEGKDVAEFLMKQEPKFPVIVHSSNFLAVQAMLTFFELGGWTARRVIPLGTGEVEWISDAWIVEVKRLLGS